MNDNNIEKQISEAIKVIDNTDIKGPDLMWFVDFVSDEQLKIAKKQSKQISIFCAIAAAVIAILFSVYKLFYSAFIIIQILSFVIPVGGLIIMRMISKEAKLQ
ncbi:DUF5345 family protein [Brassicibacter mesophilus]|uniref:DUF5345 family protein n=1 Tax=Brassicibacter mesophilus TaxID=745119 RepID=UPI003D2541FD